MISSSLCRPTFQKIVSNFQPPQKKNKRKEMSGSACRQVREGKCTGTVLCSISQFFLLGGGWDIFLPSVVSPSCLDVFVVITPLLWPFLYFNPFYKSLILSFVPLIFILHSSLCSFRFECRLNCVCSVYLFVFVAQGWGDTPSWRRGYFSPLYSFS